MFSTAIEELIEHIDFSEARIKQLPPILLVFGGPLSVEEDKKNISCRNVFISSVLSSSHKLAKFIKTPEDYPEWNTFEGYSNLIEFERDAGCLSSCTLLFLESEGSIAELGSFVMDETLRERLLVVISKKHFIQNSYISLGPIKLIQSLIDEEDIEDAIYVANSIGAKYFPTEMDDLVEMLDQKFSSYPKTKKFDSTSIRDQLLIIADLIELFGALTKKEIKRLIETIGIKVNKNRLNQMVNLLKIFELIVQPVTGSTKYFIAPPSETRKVYLDYKANKGTPNFDRYRFKLRAFSIMQKDAVRKRAYESVHKKDAS